MTNESLNPNQRGLYSKSGIQIISTPTVVQLQNLPSDPRVEYFSTLGDKPILTSDQVDPKYAGNFMNPETSPYFLYYCVNPLSDKIKIDLTNIVKATGQRAVGIRGSACSLNGTLDHESIIDLDSHKVVIRSIDQIVKEGSDTGLRKTKIVSVSLPGLNEIDVNGVSDLSLIRGFPRTYLQVYPRMLRFYLNRKGFVDESIFPLLLIYDLKYVAEYEALITLPDSIEERTKPILRAYVLDYPIF